MITEDEKVYILKSLKNAHQALQLNEEMEEGEDFDPSFKHVAYSLAEGALATIAKTYNLDSKIEQQVFARTNTLKKQYARIEQIEAELLSRSDKSTFKQSVKEVANAINIRWNNAGFNSAYNVTIRETGKINVDFNLSKLTYPWDLQLEEDSADLDPKYTLAFLSNNFDCVQEDEYCYLLANENNEQKIKQLLDRLYPGATIWSFKRRRFNEDQFILDRADVILSNLLFLEEKNNEQN